MNYIDVILIAPVVFFSIKGLLSGFINQIAGLFGLIAGFYFSLQFYEHVGFYIAHFQKSEYNNIIAFVLLFIAIYLFVSLVGKLITKASKSLALNPINRVFGLLFGGVKGVLILSLLLVLFHYAKDLTNNELTNAITNSIVYTTLAPYVKELNFNSIGI